MSHTIAETKKTTFSVTTTIEGDSIIVHRTHKHKDGISKRISEEIMEAKDKQVIEAMIAMGWTHPDIEGETE